MKLGGVAAAIAGVCLGGCVAIIPGPPRTQVAGAGAVCLPMPEYTAAQAAQLSADLGAIKKEHPVAAQYIADAYGLREANRAACEAAKKEQGK